MTTSSLFLSRHFTNQSTEKTKQLIVFRLRQEWFALSIEKIKKVIPLGEIYGDSQKTGIGLTVYEGRELIVVDLAYRIFGAASLTTNQVTTHWQANDLQRYLVIMETETHQAIALPIDSPPEIRRVSESAFTNLSEAYIVESNLQGVSSIMVVSKEQPPLFLLDPDQIAQGLKRKKKV